VPCALGIDVGTTNVKVVLVRDDGSTAAYSSRALATRRSGDTAEQDPDALWRAVVDAAREVTAAAAGDAAGVTSIACDSQYSSIVPVDGGGRPLAPLVMWMDVRGGPHLLDLLGREADAFGEFLDRHGIPPIGGGIALGHILHLLRDDTVARHVAAFLEPMDFVNLRLTGRVAATQATMFMSLLCDNRSLGVTRYDDELVRMARVDPRLLPPLLVAGDAVGELVPEVAAELGLPAGAVVRTGANDSQVQALATGVFDPGRGAVVIGTTAVVLDVIADRRPTDLDHQVLSMPGALPDHYVVWAENGIAGKALEHVLENLVYSSDVLGDHSAADRFAALDAALDAAPAGSGGVLFMPWLNGSLSPRADASMRGGFLNLSLDTTRPMIVRSVVEGITFNLRWLLPAVEAYTERRMDEVVFGGGAACSSRWGQILADMLDRPVRTLADPARAAARGAAYLALVAEGVLSRDDVVGRLEMTREQEPRAEHHDTYERLFEQFVNAFEQNRPIFEALNS
jgi:xylulokinase